MHDKQTVAVLVMYALEFEYQLALGHSDSNSTLAQDVMQTHVCAQNFGHLYRFEEIDSDRGRWLSQCVRIACMILLGARIALLCTIYLQQSQLYPLSYFDW